MRSFESVREDPEAEDPEAEARTEPPAVEATRSEAFLETLVDTFCSELCQPSRGDDEVQEELAPEEDAKSRGSGWLPVALGAAAVSAGVLILLRLELLCMRRCERFDALRTDSSKGCGVRRASALRGPRSESIDARWLLHYILHTRTITYELFTR